MKSLMPRLQVSMFAIAARSNGRMRLVRSKTTFATVVTLMLMVYGWEADAQLVITSSNANYSQNFNSYNPTDAANLAATIPAGWTANSSGSSTFQGRGTGTSATGGYYGLGSGSDFSLGALRSGTPGNISYAAGFTNGTGLQIRSIAFAWNYEQWRYANNSGWDVSGTGGLTADALLNSKDFTGISSGTNGTVTATSISEFVVSSIAIAPTGAFGVSWVTTDGTSSDNAVSIDDFSMKLKELATTASSTAVSSLNYGSEVAIVNGHGGQSELDAVISGVETMGGTLSDGGVHALSVSKSGEGTLTLSGVSSYSGTTSVSNGTLVVNGGLSGSGSVTVANNAKLIGTGSIAGATTVQSGGKYSAGALNAVGSQTFGSSLNFNDGSVFDWDINSNSNVSGFDTVSAGGAIDVGTNGTIFKVIFGNNVSFEDSFWNTPYATRTWALSSIFGKAFNSGGFQTVQTSQDVSQHGAFSISNTALTWTAVPEPGNAVAGALLALGLLRRRRLPQSFTGGN